MGLAMPPTLEDAQIPDATYPRRALPDKISEYFGQQCARHVIRYVRHQLRRHENDEIVRLAGKAVFVGDAVFHDVLDLFRLSSAYRRA
jgi:hypothetical protein